MKKVTARKNKSVIETAFNELVGECREIVKADAHAKPLLTEISTRFRNPKKSVEIRNAIYSLYYLLNQMITYVIVLKYMPNSSVNEIQSMTQKCGLFITVPLQD